jgi:hypothetical protein
MYGGLEGRREGEMREVKKQLLNSLMKGMKLESSEKQWMNEWVSE